MNKLIYSDAKEVARRSLITDTDELEPGKPTIVVARETTRERKANLNDQEKNLRRRVTTRSARVVDTIGYIGSAKKPWIDQAIWDCFHKREVNPLALAKKLGARLVFEDLSRVIRHPAFDAGSNVDVEPTPKQIDELRHSLRGVRLMLDLPADATQSQIRSYQRKRGIWAKKPEHYQPRWNQCLEVVAKALQLHEKGWSYSEIAKAVRRRRATIQTWCRNYVYEFDEVCIKV
jgi:Putative ATPase subunit of terminase (gpP-like)